MKTLPSARKEYVTLPIYFESLSSDCQSPTHSVGTGAASSGVGRGLGAGKGGGGFDFFDPFPHAEKPQLRSRMHTVVQDIRGLQCISYSGLRSIQFVVELDGPS